LIASRFYDPLVEFIFIVIDIFGPVINNRDKNSYVKFSQNKSSQRQESLEALCLERDPIKEEAANNQK